MLQEKFIRIRANEVGERRAIADLDKRGIAAHETWLFRFGGELHRNKSFLPLLWAGLQAPEYTLKEAFSVPKGNRFSHENFRYVIINGELMDNIVKVDVPVYYFMGRYDMTTPYVLSKEYFQKLDAPHKDFITFEQSSHFPFFEEPQRFAEEMKRILRNSLNGVFIIHLAMGI